MDSFKLYFNFGINGFSFGKIAILMNSAYSRAREYVPLCWFMANKQRSSSTTTIPLLVPHPACFNRPPSSAHQRDDSQTNSQLLTDPGIEQLPALIWMQTGASPSSSSQLSDLFCTAIICSTFHTHTYIYLFVLLGTRN